MAYSTCCGAETNETDMGICPDCLEHCEFETECDECEGTGEKEGFPAMCDKCQGSGVISVD